MSKRGNCYVTSEAIYHLIGGKRAGWIPQVLRLPDGGTHWFLQHRETGLIIDATRSQFTSKPRYETSRGSGFLTKGPSKRARALMKKLVWKE